MQSFDTPRRYCAVQYITPLFCTVYCTVQYSDTVPHSPVHTVLDCSRLGMLQYYRRKNRITGFRSDCLPQQTKKGECFGSVGATLLDFQPLRRRRRHRHRRPPYSTVFALAFPPSQELLSTASTTLHHQQHYLLAARAYPIDRSRIEFGFIGEKVCVRVCVKQGSSDQRMVSNIVCRVRNT